MSARILQGDSAEVLKALPANSIDLTVTSPPYDNLRTYNGFTFDFETIAAELYRVTKPGGVVVWVVGDATVNGSETGTSFRQALHFKDIGFNLHDTMIYAKQNYVPLTHNRYEQQFEYMFVLSKGKPATFRGQRTQSKGVLGGSTWYETDGTTRAAHRDSRPSTDKLKPNIWTYAIGSTRCGHPAVFPEQLAADHIASWSNPGDTVLDPFMGSGTTGKMALQAAREFVGIEISAEYIEIAKARIGMEDDVDAFLASLVS